MRTFVRAAELGTLMLVSVRGGPLVIVANEASSVVLAGHIQVDSNGQLTVFEHYSGWLSDAQAPVLAAFISFWLSFLACQALSWRRSSGARRQQLKWLLSGAAICLACLAVSVTLCSFPGIWQCAVSRASGKR